MSSTESSQTFKRLIVIRNRTDNHHASLEMTDLSLNKRKEIQMKILERTRLRLLMIAGALLLLPFFSYSQDVVPKFKHSIGAGAGFITGYGLSYRYKPSEYGFQFNLAPYTDKITSRFSVGVTFQKYLIEGKITNFYLYQGNHFYYSNEINTTGFEPVTNKPITERIKDSYFNNGLGIGIEILIAGRIGLNLMTGYAFYVNFTQVNITGEVGLYYKL